MTISDGVENSILDLVFRATSWAGYAMQITTTSQVAVAVALHRADPGDAGNAATSETTYTSYTRTSISRSAAGFNAPASGTVSAAAALSFPAGSGGGDTVSFFSASFSNAAPATGTQTILWSGAVSPVIGTGSGVTPQLSPINIALD